MIYEYILVWGILNYKILIIFLINCFIIEKKFEILCYVIFFTLNLDVKVVLWICAGIFELLFENFM